MTERAPSKWRLRRLARREAREARIAASAPELGGGSIVAATPIRPAWAQFMARLRIEVRQVLTSPGLIVLTLLAIAFTALVLWVARALRHYRTTRRWQRR